MTKELEVKILDIDVDYMEKKIMELGGTLLSKELQVNTLIDSNIRPIKSYLDAYLRIRETKDLLNNKESTTLTLKKNIKNTHMRENIELNSKIESKEVVLEILKDLGFDKIEVGHKKRTSYEFKGARIDIDIWDEKTYPYPYMEIEVENKETLDLVVEMLGIKADQISTKSIVELRDELVNK
jgi:adenylate cyclase class 2